MFYVDSQSSRLRGWLPTKELAEKHCADWPDEGMSVSPEGYITGAIDGLPPRLMTGETVEALNEHNANVARTVSHGHDAFRYKPTEPEEPKDEWQPWDSAPRDGSYFDAWVEPNNRTEKARRVAHVQFCTVFNEFHAWEPHSYEYQEIHEIGKPTHWRPEPEGPKK